MSQSNSFTLKQLFDSHKNRKIQALKNTLSFIPLSQFGDAKLFGLGSVSRITSKDVMVSALFATYVGCEFIREKQYKILHISLDKHMEKTGLNYLSNITKTKIREFKNPNFSIDHKQSVVDELTKYIDFMPISGSTKFNTEMMSLITPKIESRLYNVIIIDGLDSIYSSKQGSFFSDVKNAYQELATLADKNETIIILTESTKHVGVTTPENFVDISVETTKKTKASEVNSFFGFFTSSGEFKGEYDVTIKSNTYIKNTELNTELCLFEPNPVNKFMTDLDAGKFRDKMVLGVKEDSHQWLTKDFFVEPNALFVGAMGSGKSISCKFSLTSWMLANSDQTLMFIVDLIKGANDYRALFSLDNVVEVLDNEQKLFSLIDYLFNEAEARKNVLNSVEATSLVNYENITGKKMARIIVCMEEFHSIPYTILDFEKKFKIPGTHANKYFMLMRIGRSLGIWFMSASQKSTKSDIPPELVPNFSNKMVFRVSKAESAYLLADSKAGNIRADQKGHCETEEGSVQFPYISTDKEEELLSLYAKPLSAELATLSLDEVQKFFGK